MFARTSCLPGRIFPFQREVITNRNLCSRGAFCTLSRAPLVMDETAGTIRADVSVNLRKEKEIGLPSPPRMPRHPRLQVQSVFNLDSRRGISGRSIAVPGVCSNSNGSLQRDKLCVTSVESVLTQDLEFTVHCTFTPVSSSGVRFIFCID